MRRAEEGSHIFSSSASILDDRGEAERLEDAMWLTELIGHERLVKQLICISTRSKRGWLELEEALIRRAVFDDDLQLLQGSP